MQDSRETSDELMILSEYQVLLWSLLLINSTLVKEKNKTTGINLLKISPNKILLCREIQVSNKK